MKKNNRFSIKNYRIPKFLTYLIFIMPIALVFLRGKRIDNDIWFLLSHGRYVLEHGIPKIEVFSMHSNMSFVMQQWLSASFFWLIYKVSSFFGLRLLLSIVFAVITYITYRLCNLISDNNTFISFLITLALQIFLAIFIVDRPQIFTYMILISELYLLELYIKKKNKKYLYPLPLLSLIQINMHASMWFMQFLFLLPYVIDSFKIKLGFIKGEGYSKKPLFITIILMALAGLINPYGIDAITYIFGSFGIEEINNYIQEMKLLNISTLLGKYFFIAMFGVLFIYVFYKKGNFKLRYFLLYCGTVFLALSNLKSVALFVISSVFPLSYYLKDSFKNYDYSNNYSKSFIYGISILYIIAILVFCGFTIETKMPENSDAIKYIEKNYDKNIKLYTSYDDGSYAEFIGFKPYIDPRAEVFLKANNKKEDIYIEYYNFENRLLSCNKFLEKYDFDLLLLSNKSAFYTCNLKNYHQVYIDSNRAVFEKNKE